MEIGRKSSTPYPLLISAVLFSLLTAVSYGNGDLSSQSLYNEIKVGLILDMGSWTGKTVHSCITMAISDFYGTNIHYKTRLFLDARDIRGADPMHAISSALDLVENVKVKAIMVLETSLVTKFLAEIGDKAKIPIFSFSSILSSSSNSNVQYSYLVQIKQDEVSQFKGIGAILNSYKWRSVIIIYEDSDDGREVLLRLVESLYEANVHIPSKIAISPSSDDDQICDALDKLKTLQPTIYIVHMSPSLISRLFLRAKMLGMMTEGYAWIVTDKTMNKFHSIDSEAVESSMQGVLGLKPYIPPSIRLRNVTLRWRKKAYDENHLMDFSTTKIDVLGIWAYDTLWALAESIERVPVELFLNPYYNGTRLLDEIRRTRFTGLSGEFRISDGRLHSEAFAIVNVIGRIERRIGFWTPKDGLVREMVQPAARGGLEDVIWPGGSATPPKGWLMPTNGGRKLRILVTTTIGFTELVNVYRDPQTNTTTSITGFCIDVSKAAIDSLDYQVPYEFVPLDADQNAQNLIPYADLINLVYRQIYDGIVLDMTITASRSLYVDFTVPYTDLGVGTVTKRENTDDMWIFLKPLSPSLWFTSAAFFALTGFVVWAIEHPTNVEFQGSVARQIGTILWFGFSTLVYAHREKLTSNLSRFVVIVWLFVVLILTSSYTATLSSVLTVGQIRSAAAMLSAGISDDFFLGGLGIIANNANFTDNQQILSPEGFADALSKGGKRGGVDAIVDEIPYIKIFLAKYGANYAMVASQSTTNGFGFVFQKGSPLVPDLSQAIIKLRGDGQLDRLERLWFYQSSFFMPEDTAADTPNVLNLDRLGGMFLISFLCCISALLVHLISILLNNLRIMNVIGQLLDRGILTFFMGRLAPRNRPNDNGIELDIMNGDATFVT